MILLRTRLLTQRYCLELSLPSDGQSPLVIRKNLIPAIASNRDKSKSSEGLRFALILHTTSFTLRLPTGSVAPERRSNIHLSAQNAEEKFAIACMHVPLEVVLLCWRGVIFGVGLFHRNRHPTCWYRSPIRCAGTLAAQALQMPDSCSFILTCCVRLQALLGIVQRCALIC